MKLTIASIKNLLDIISGGLRSEEGSAGIPGDFCVQQAVNTAMHGGTDDRPHCVGSVVRNLGITLNDSQGWSSDKARADGLRRFAVAELGSDEIDQVRVQALMRKKFREKHPNYLERGAWDGMISWALCPTSMETKDEETVLKGLAEMAVQVLKELKSPGTRYLYLCESKRDPQGAWSALVFGEDHRSTALSSKVAVSA
jgi:hypothetical protein